jgi:hypothetical protein
MITLSSLNLNVTAAIADVVHFKSTVIVRHAHAAGYHILCAGRLAQTWTVWSVRADGAYLLQRV